MDIDYVNHILDNHMKLDHHNKYIFPIYEVYK